MTPDDILRIARAVFPDNLASPPRINHEGDVCANGYKFDPLNSNDDAFRVQCWLLKWRGKQNQFIEVSPWHVGQYYFDGMEEDGRITSWTVMHDGTEAGLRRAITEAAGRVVG